jgi:2-polyprenyl-3-methyl-5-hydroxy-6-metoxy-1,4-benzoquinol methylase
MRFRQASKSYGNYSVEREREYYARSKPDASARPYEFVEQYIRGSIGMDFFRGKSVLDIGCGEGIYSAWIADCGGAREVLGIELTGHRIRFDYQKKLANLVFVEGNVIEYDFGARRFDIVFMNLVLHHLRFVLADVAKIVNGVLRPGGTFVAFEPNVYSPGAVLAHMIHDRSMNEGFLTPRQARRAFESAGLEDVSVGYFWRNRRWAKNPLLASSFWIRASKPVREA